LKIYGVGASDNKSGVAAMLEIAKILTKAEVKLKGKIILLFTSREETHEGKEDSRRLALSGLKAEGGICLDTHLLEDGFARLVVGCRGIMNLTLKVLGRSYHSSEPEKGVNAIYNAIKYIENLRKLKLPRKTKPLKMRSNLSVTKIWTNGWATRIPDKCCLTVNYRALPNENLEKVKNRLLRLASKSCKAGFGVENVEGSDGYLLSLGEPIVKASLEALKAMKLKVKPTLSLGWIDAAEFLFKAGIPMVGIGPVTRGQAHVVDEYEDVEALKLGTEAAFKAALKFLET
jgi:acetylornithine deacetylase/succinyl-diaminopimelate desuccinylase-like protein